ncbi:Uma2 family endonuclease [Polyangium jinanense]|uniref:Uma2 family endonuclease n=1 Tax=Polyangium jinanense TaxID=2829994 RepID=A0A9X4B0B9_9BACT|nr:Uma2 family endonuclease [Polyangium jinanense]MDC3958456.1 Uma2 family endonuclease [Polyangium jinanense]MDC3989315.1 Uma2 family endonuclease [Polyangium jinanense]
MGDPARRIKPPAKPATLEDLLVIPEEERRHEIIDGELVEKAAPSPRHGSGHTSVVMSVGPSYHRPSGRGGPGGWWILTETEILFEARQLYRPDVSGWRRERLPQLPDTWPMTLRPDWVCEILSPNNTTNDTVKKRRTYHRFQVPHYWILDPMRGELTVYRWAEGGYLVAAEATRGERIRAEPFDEVELDIDELLGYAEEEGPPAGEP